MKKFNFFVIFIITFIILTSVINIYAETASPENTELPEAIATPTPTPVNNVISTIGDFSLNAMFADKRIVDEDLSINVKKLNINDISPEIIQAVRAKDGDKDIFLYFKLTLQLNGRDTVQNSVIDIEINGNEIIAEYQSISLFRVNNNQVTKVTDEETDGNIKFSASELGTFLVIGVKNPQASNKTENPQQNSPTLQTDDPAGIITPGSTGTTDNENKGSITPGAFVFWIIAALIIGLWLGLGIGYILWGRYKTKKIQRGPYVIGEQ